jgi:hypothetical protein
VTTGPPLIIFKAMDNDESYDNTIVLTVLKNELTMTAYVPFHVRKSYYYPLNPVCAMAAEGMKTVYADPWNTSM